VGPVWHGGGKDEARLLSDAYRNSLELAIRKGLKRISFPSISTGAYGYPLIDAARTALEAVKEFLEKKDSMEEVNFVLFTESDLRTYEETAVALFGKPGNRPIHQSGATC
jgi:O-acetyl-ADP-ribose deacetylase (regulator of RNase III)